MPAIRVLLIEDDFDVRNLLQSSIQPSYEVLHASNGMEGLRMALNGQPDLIVTDIMMPVMDGHEFVKRLRRFQNFETIPVIFLSSLTSSDHIRKGYELGAALYLSKPIDPTRFRRNLDLFVDDHGIVPHPKKQTVDEVQAAFSEVQTMLDPRSTQSRPRPAPAPVMVPSMPSTPAPAAHAPQHAPAEELKLRLMIVEHEPEATKTINNSLEKEYELILAKDGIEAIERAVRYQPDIFVIDDQIPKMAAPHLISMIRKDRLFQRAPIVFITNKADPHSTMLLERAGVKFFIPKPIDMSRLKNMLREAATTPGFEIHRERPSFQQVRLELGIAEGLRNPGGPQLRPVPMKPSSEPRRGAVHKKEPDDTWRG